MRGFTIGLVVGSMYAVAWTMTAVTSPFRWLNDRRRRHRSQPSEPNRSPRSEVTNMHMKRACGYCENTECDDYAKGMFLLNHGDVFYCPRCRQIGHVQKEEGSYVGESDIFQEVRVEYNFDSIPKAFREIAIVRDEGLPSGHNVYTLKSPLVRTEARALKIAEAVLSNLNRYRGILAAGEIPRTTESLLSFDDSSEVFSQKLGKLSEEWENSGLVEQAATSNSEEDWTVI